ncbi:transport protein [Streptococcus iniae]|uniref:MFS transporter n=1 Tax=Streptococcus iniae TaxID=1346 RepID=A0ABM5QFL1_STRIN|nr:hypothetical protein DQ08_00630 [Streptococcus iniae]EKB52254.1 hypothetical protein A0G_0089 [Streptococcus iniae 9117]AHY16888.1 hypothetical protein DW64_00630 [Streptococcus iniae]AJG25176.1 hypothetical protein SI82_00730 [Streptococcus iniae]APD31079.1 hypothetical protein BMF34_00810 [Streptococcus iniae]
MFKQSYKKNIGLLGASEFFAFFGITSFWLLFLSQNGMSLLEIGLLESLFHATSLLSEVPSGILADRFSYKSNLYLSRLTAILSAIEEATRTLGMVLAGFLIHGFLDVPYSCF